MIARRSFLAGLGALITAPAIVRADALMPVRSISGHMRALLWHDILCDRYMIDVTVSPSYLLTPPHAKRIDPGIMCGNIHALVDRYCGQSRPRHVTRGITIADPVLDRGPGVEWFDDRHAPVGVSYPLLSREFVP